MRITVVVGWRSRLALAERTELLLRAADVSRVAFASTPREALGQLEPHDVAYLLDVNRLTNRVAAGLRIRRRPYVVDTGDDPATLARKSKGAVVAGAYGVAERLMLGAALGVVCRGSFHVPILRSRTDAPLLWAPDTVPDVLVDGHQPAMDPGVIATFGSASRPREGDRAYGWETIDVLASLPDHTGVIVVNGDGIDALRDRARRMGVHGRVTIQGPAPLPALARRLEGAAFITSVQSDDLAGWVRTTGKLPIALGLGKVLVATRVGEAVRVLPPELLVSPADDGRIVTQMARVVSRGVPLGWSDTNEARVAPFRRSFVAAQLGQFLRDL